MSYRALAEALLRGSPYFGSALAAQQGDFQRHSFFFPAVHFLLQKNRLKEPVRVLEIGCWAGASTISWCDALKKCGLSGEVYCVDPWEPYFGDQEEDRTYRKMDEAARLGLIPLLFEHNIRAAGVAHLVNVDRGRSQDVLPRLPDRSFSIVYIDGSHSYEAVLFDLCQARRLVTAGGLVCGDDLELQADSLPDHELKAALQTGRDFVYSESAGRHFHPGVTAAVAREFGKVAVWNGFWAIEHSLDGWTLPALDVSQAQMPDHLRSWCSTPTLLKTCRGYNLVRAGDRYFAVAQSLGPVDLLQEALGDRELPPLLLLGNSLEELEARLKGALQLKSLEERLTSDLADTKAEVSALAAQAQNWKDSAAEELGDLHSRLKEVYYQQRLCQHQLKVMRWGPGDPETPCAAGNYRGFALFHFRGRIYALANDFDEDQESVDSILRSAEGSAEQKNIFAADSMDGIRTHIDLVLGLAEVQRDIQSIVDQFRLHVGTPINAGNKPPQAAAGLPSI